MEQMFGLDAARWVLEWNRLDGAPMSETFDNRADAESEAAWLEGYGCRTEIHAEGELGIRDHLAAILEGDELAG